MLCAFLLGFGDSCYNTQVMFHTYIMYIVRSHQQLVSMYHTPNHLCVYQGISIYHFYQEGFPYGLYLQIYSILGVLYPMDERSTPAMALFKFFQVYYSLLILYIEYDTFVGSIPSMTHSCFCIKTVLITSNTKWYSRATSTLPICACELTTVNVQHRDAQLKSGIASQLSPHIRVRQREPQSLEK